MVQLAQIEHTHRVLEPSGGTGNILWAIGNAPEKVAVEINGQLVRQLLFLGLSGLHSY
jgi:tRNA G10  N-methylase Trm11